MSSWFDKGKDIVIESMARDCDVSFLKMLEIYEVFQEHGFIDYDVEKELFYSAVEGEEG